VGIAVSIVRLPGAEDLPMPAYMSGGASGMDLCAAVTESVVIRPGRFSLIPTGIRISLPDGYEAQIRPRSGLALKHGVTLLNAPGTIDADYRGEISVIAVNFGRRPFAVTRGMRIAQMVFCKVERARLNELGTVREFEETCGTERGCGGFGHTGV